MLIQWRCLMVHHLKINILLTLWQQERLPLTSRSDKRELFYGFHWS